MKTFLFLFGAIFENKVILSLICMMLQCGSIRTAQMADQIVPTRFDMETLEMEHRLDNRLWDRF